MSPGQTGHITGQMGRVPGTDGTHTIFSAIKSRFRSTRLPSEVAIYRTEELPRCENSRESQNFALAKSLAKNVSRLLLGPFELHFQRKEDKQNFTKRFS